MDEKCVILEWKVESAFMIVIFELSEGVADSHNTEMTSPSKAISGCTDSREELFQVQMASMPGFLPSFPLVPRKTTLLLISVVSTELWLHQPPLLNPKSKSRKKANYCAALQYSLLTSSP